jgi:ELWxxDGT repeat protein
VGNFIYFFADDGIHGRELWITNGTTAGTRMVVDLNPGDGDTTMTHMTAFNNMLFFVYHDGIYKHGRELWRTDGTSAGTVMVKDIGTGLDVFDRANNADPKDLTVVVDVHVGGRLYFSAWGPEYGRGLWQTDGTTEGTRLVQEMDLRPPGSYNDGGKPYALANIDGVLFFGARSQYLVPDKPYTGYELWKVMVTPKRNTSIMNYLPFILME